MPLNQITKLKNFYKSKFSPVLIMLQSLDDKINFSMFLTSSNVNFLPKIFCSCLLYFIGSLTYMGLLIYLLF